MGGDRERAFLGGLPQPPIHLVVSLFSFRILDENRSGDEIRCTLDSQVWFFHRSQKHAPSDSVQSCQLPS